MATGNDYRLTFRLAAVPSIFAIFMLLYYVQKPQRLQTKHYGMPQFPARQPRPAPSKHRHGRGPLAMVYEPVRWRRAQCKDKGRDMAWHRGGRTWRRVGEWLTGRVLATRVPVAMVARPSAVTAAAACTCCPFPW